MSDKPNSPFRNIILITFVIGGVSYFGYKKYISYSIESARNHYESKTYLDYSRFEEEGDKLQEKMVGKEVVIDPNKIGNEDLKKMVSEQIPMLIRLEEACKKEYEEMMPNKMIVDPEDPFFKENKEALFEKAENIIRQSPNRNQALGNFERFGKTLEKIEEIDSQVFLNIVRAHLVCKSQNFNILLESMNEASKLNGWDPEMVKAGFDSLLVATSDRLDNDNLPDSILFSLNTIKIAGENSNLGDDFFQEIDVIYSELAEFEDHFGDIPEGVIKNPVKYYDEYMSELEQIADEARFLIARKLEGKYKSVTPNSAITQ